MKHSSPPTAIVLPVYPQYATMMYDRTKQWEYRRNIFQPSVTTIYLYETAPVSIITGSVVVDHIERAPLEQLWERTHALGGISREKFDRYFAGLGIGHAIQVGNPVRYAQPMPLIELGLEFTPQSFVYLPLLPWLQ